MLRSAVLGVGLCACAIPADDVVEDVAVGEVALYRVENGDSLSTIADALSLPGGWRELARFNGVGETIRAGTGLRIPVGYIREAGLDPVRDFGLEPFTPPDAPAPLVPCASEASRGRCVEAGDRVLCLEDDTANDYHAVVLYRGGVRMHEFVLDPWSLLRGELLLERVDLDGDRSEELVVAIPEWSTGTLGVEASKVLVIDARDRVTRLDVEQWGTGSLVEGDAGRCDLLATTWQSLLHPLEGEGTYFVGRRMAYVDGTLVPQAGTVARRLHTYFHLPPAHPDEIPTPADWLAASPGWSTLGATEPVHATQRGTITDVHLTDDRLDVYVALASGGTTLLSTDEEAGICGSWRVRVDAFVWAPTGTWFPPHYTPAAPDPWIGADVLIEDRSSEEDPSCDPDEYPLFERLVYVAPR